MHATANAMARARPPSIRREASAVSTASRYPACVWQPSAYS